MKTKYLIIGGGISGLTFANFVDDYLIVEKDSVVGGYCKTIKKKDFLWDYAGHFFHFKTDEFKKIFLNNLNKNNIITKEKNTKIHYKDKLIDYPFQTNIHQLPKEEFIDCLYDLFKRFEKEKYDNFLDMLFGKFGKSITNKFLLPYNEKLYACNLKTLDQDAMGRFFPYADINDVIDNMKVNNDNSYNNSFLYPKEGAGSFINKLYSNLDKNKVLLNTEIIKIDEDKKTAYFKNGKIHYDYLINTSPLNKFLLLFECHEKKNLSAMLSYNKVLVFNLGFNKNSKYKEHWVYVPSEDINFYRMGFYNNILNQDKLSMYIEIGFGKDQTINREVIDRELNLTLENLKKMKVIDDSYILEEYISIVMDPAYVHINKKINNKKEKLFKRFEKSSIYNIGRYAEWTYCSMEDCMVSAKNLSEKIGKQ